MNPNDEKCPKDDEAPKPAPPRRFDATLPMGRKPAPAAGDPDLDLDLGDVQSRLPYGSEDIADK